MSQSPLIILGGRKGRNEGWGDPELEQAFWCCQAVGWVVWRDLRSSGHFSINPAFPWAHPSFIFSAISSSIWSSIEWR